MVLFNWIALIYAGTREPLHTLSTSDPGLGLLTMTRLHEPDCNDKPTTWQLIPLPFASMTGMAIRWLSGERTSSCSVHVVLSRPGGRFKLFQDHGLMATEPSPCLFFPAGDVRVRILLLKTKEHQAGPMSVSPTPRAVQGRSRIPNTWLSAVHWRCIMHVNMQ